jgi:hypothetical protein
MLVTKSAKIIGAGKPTSSVPPLIKSVFRIIRRKSLLKKASKCLNPTQELPKNPSDGE